MTDTPTITERENGPLVVKNIKTLKGPNGENIEVKEVMALCRCGGSSNKPFCDGTHNKNGFESRGGEPAGRDRLIDYEGAEITVTYNPRVCSHAAECGRLASHIFNPEQKPWVQPDKGTLDDVRAVIAACPSGALSIKEASGEMRHIVPDRAEIEVQKDGPYWVTGVEPPADLAGEGMTAEKFVLCRCGLSGNKPFCDGSHRDKGWKAS